MARDVHDARVPRRPREVAIAPYQISNVDQQLRMAESGTDRIDPQLRCLALRASVGS